MLQLSGPRLLAISLLGSAFGYWGYTQEAPTLERYQAMSHDALLAELARQSTTDLSVSLFGGLFVVGGIVIAVDVLTRFFTAVGKRLALDSADQPQDPAAA